MGTLTPTSTCRWTSHLSTACYNILDNRAEDVVNTFAMAKKGFESGALKPEAAMSMMEQAVNLLAAIRETLQTR